MKMKEIYKSIMGVLFGGAAISSIVIGIGAETVGQDFLKRRTTEVSETPAMKVASRHKSAHRTSSLPKSNSPRNISAQSDAEAQKFQCVLTYSDTWEYYDEAGVYTFGASDPISFNNTFVNEEYSPSGGAFFTDKYYVLTTMSEDWFTGEVSVASYKFSRNNWEEISYAPQNIYSLYNSICYDPIDNRAYGYFYTDEGGDWGYMDVDNLSVTHLAPVVTPIVAVAVNDCGMTYGVGSDGYFYSVDKKTGTMTKIGSTGLSPYYMQSMAFAPDGQLYWAASEELSSGLYTIDVATGKASKVSSFNGSEEVCALYALQTVPQDNAPSQATDLKVELVGKELTFPFTFTIPDKTYRGEPLSEEIEYAVYVDGVICNVGAAQSGTSVTETLTVETPGYHLFKVVLSNEAGNSEGSTARYWIGVDQPLSVSDTEVTKTSDNSISLSWKAPAGGVNGGFFDADLVTYNVTRLPDNIVIGENIKTTSFKDEISIETGQSFIRYIITPTVEGLEGQGTETAGIIMGNPYEVPVEFTFDSVEDYNIFTVIDNNETVNLDSGMWEYTPSGEAAGYVSGTKDGDDWLITPSIYLHARTQYIFSHDVLCYSDYWPEQYSVYLGQSPAPESMTTEIVPSTTIWWDEYRTRTDTITIDEEGVYYFGFHATSDAGTVFFLLDNVKLREMYKLDAPAEVGNFNVKAGEKGAKTASISFEAPLSSVSGEELSNNFAIKVLRNGIEMMTKSDVAPGEQLTIEDNNPIDRSMNTYEVICCNDEGDGPGVSAQVWVGLDEPTAPLNARVSLDEEGHPVISWDAPEGRGVHGGYVDNSDLSYTVAVEKDGGLSPIVVDTEEHSCVDDATVYDNSGAQEMHQYYIVPLSNATGEYGENATALYISGQPYRLPFKESFKGRTPTNFWAFTGTNGEGWFIGDDWEVGSQDYDDGVLSYLPAVPDVVTTAMSGKIDINGANNPKLTFYLRKMGVADNGFYDTDPSKDVLNIKVGIDGFNLETISTIRLEDVKKTGEFIYYSIPLSNLDAKEYIVVTFEYEAVSARTPLMIDNIVVKEGRDYNAVAGEINAPEAVEVFENLEVKASVENVGDNLLTDVKVRLMRGALVEAETTIDNIAPDQSQTVTLEAMALPEWGEEAEFTVYVDADNDEVEADNSSNPFKISVIYHDRPAVSDLAGNIEDDELHLNWSEPDDLSNLDKTVTESLDSYNHGDLSFGQWISEDKSFWGFEGIKTITVDGIEIEIPNSDDEQAFIVFNPALAGIDLNENSEWTPISGNNVIACFGDAANDYLESNNDWLISPELSGQKQTISFWAKTATKKGRPDDIRVLVAADIEFNNDGTVRSSCFSSLEDGDITLTRDWEKYEFEIPAGSKYFAIRNISDDGYAVLIDDITYDPFIEKTNANLVGYNVYLNGEMLNSEPIEDTTYIVSPIMEGDYTVRVVYDEGESVDSNVVEIRNTSISDIDTDEDVIYYDLNGIRVSNPEPGKIYIRQTKDKTEKVICHN